MRQKPSDMATTASPAHTLWVWLLSQYSWALDSPQCSWWVPFTTHSGDLHGRERSMKLHGKGDKAPPATTAITLSYAVLWRVCP